MTATQPQELIKAKALSLGFDACGIASCKTFEKESRVLEDWLNNRYHADMDIMLRNRDKREKPCLLHPETKSVIVVLLSYHDHDFIHHKQSAYQVAEYALGKDYHKVVKTKLHLFSSYINELFPEALNRCFVDSAPLFEKAFAVEAGLVWIGKNTLLVTPKGSKYFIGEIFTNIPLPADKAYHKNHCANCNRCVEACPTHALDLPYQLNANKCLSYHSIERKHIEWDNSIKSNHYIYGCDICQQVCPYNAKKNTTQVEEFSIKPPFLHFTNEDWEQINPDTFQALFTDSAVLRIGYQKFKENIRRAKESIE